MKKIENIKELISILNSCENKKIKNCYLDAMRRIDISIDEWEDHFLFKESGPGRVCLSKTNEYDLLLSCWEKGQEGPIHDINSEEAWIHPICGEFREERYKLSENKLEQVSSVLLNDQSYSYMQKSETIYKYINTYETRSVCLHLYSRQLEEWNEYNKESGVSRVVKNQYDLIEV